MSQTRVFLQNNSQDSNQAGAPQLTVENMENYQT